MVSICVVGCDFNYLIVNLGVDCFESLVDILGCVGVLV